MRVFSNEILKQATTLIEISKVLDYDGIIRHQKADVIKLKEALEALDIVASSVESLGDYASSQDTSGQNAFSQDALSQDALSQDAAGQNSSDQNRSGQDSAAQNAESAMADEKQSREHRIAIMTALKTEGFEDRIGKIYNSFSRNRSIPFSDAPHRRGIPAFDMVVAPDFSPCSGMHGIFVGKHEAMSIILASDAGGEAEWAVIKRKSFANTEEMVDAVTLLSAGFE